MSFNCKERKGLIGGESFDIKCGNGTGGSVSAAKTASFDSNGMDGVRRASGGVRAKNKAAGRGAKQGLKKGTPYIATEKGLCSGKPGGDNCLIHFGSTDGTATSSNGCIVISDTEVLDKMAKCMGINEKIDWKNADPGGQEYKPEQKVSFKVEGFKEPGTGTGSGGTAIADNRPRPR